MALLNWFVNCRILEDNHKILTHLPEVGNGYYTKTASKFYFQEQAYILSPLTNSTT